MVMIQLARILWKRKNTKNRRLVLADFLTDWKSLLRKNYQHYEYTPKLNIVSVIMDMEERIREIALPNVRTRIDELVKKVLLPPLPVSLYLLLITH